MKRSRLFYLPDAFKSVKHLIYCAPPLQVLRCLLFIGVIFVFISIIMMSVFFCAMSLFMQLFCLLQGVPKNSINILHWRSTSPNPDGRRLHSCHCDTHPRGWGPWTKSILRFPLDCTPGFPSKVQIIAININVSHHWHPDIHQVFQQLPRHHRCWTNISQFYGLN